MKDRFLIAPFNSGLVSNVRPWLIPDDAFASLRNAYVFRGRVRKRFGSRLMNGAVDSDVAQLYSRFRINIGTTDGAGALAITNLPLNTGDMAIGMMFSIDDVMYTITALGNPATIIATGSGTLTVNTTASPATIIVAGAAATSNVYFYPALPVMGLPTYEQANINDEVLLGFDTRFAYQYSGTDWGRIGSKAWTGSDSQFFWTCNWIGTNRYETYLFAVNYNNADGIAYWDGSTWATITPAIASGGGAATINSSRIVLPFKDRLILLNTIESTGTYVARCRYSQNGSPVASDAWYEAGNLGKGGFIDAPTKEAIVSAALLYDRLIVFFERSTWELVYTNNQVLPFVWQRIDAELGVESPQSSIVMDKQIFGIGNVGIHACNGSFVQRIDQKIPDEVFNIHNDNQGTLRVAGIRDFTVELLYWTFPSLAPSQTKYPNRVLIYNYQNGSWAFNDDSITAFGYYQNSDTLAWNETNLTWEEFGDVWNSGALQAKFRNVVAGNQEGFTFIIYNPPSASDSRNSPALQITNISIASNIITLTIINHNLYITDYIILENLQGTGDLPTTLNNLVFDVDAIVDANTIQVIYDGTDSLTGTYTGGGTVARVSQVDILTKQYNFYNQAGTNFTVNKIDFNVDKTSNGEVTVDSFASFSELSLNGEEEATGSGIGDGTLETRPYSADYAPLEQTQSQLWHPVYPNVQGEVAQFRIYLNDAQMRDTSITWSDFTMNAMMIYASKTGRFQ